MFFKENWWKVLAAVLLIYSVIMGFVVDVPIMHPTYETLRNIFYHVGMWFAMFCSFIISFVYSLRYLKGFKEEEDIRSVEAVNVGIIFGVLGLLTGMIWAHFTWNFFWTNDPKLNGAAVGIIIYLAYLVLRGSMEETHKRAKVSAVYNIFAFVLLIVFVLILPRLQTSIHPGGKGEANPVLPMDLDAHMRFVFYPAMAGWILLSIWIWKLRVRIRQIGLKMEKEYYQES